MIVIKIILIVLQISLFAMCILSCAENESKELGFWIVLWIICTILKYAVC